MGIRAAALTISLAASLATVTLSGLLAAGLQDWFGVSDLGFLIVSASSGPESRDGEYSPP